MALALSFAGSTAAHAQAGPFTCDGDIFQVQSGQLRIFDPIVSSYVDIGPQNSGYNATGFNILDNFAYGAQGGNVIRIHSDGFIETIFSVGFNSFSGDVDDSNTLWLRRASNRYIGFDVSTGNIVDDITFSGTVQNVADAAYVRDGSDDYLIGFAAGRTGIFDLNTGVARRTTVSGLPGGTYGATWTDANDRIFTFNNTSGQIFEVFDVLTNSPTAVLVAQGDPSGSNDGFSCFQAPFPNLPPLAFDDDFVTPQDVAVTDNVLLDHGNGPDEDPENGPLTLDTTPVSGPSNGTVVLNSNGIFTYTPAPGFIGTDSFTYMITDQTGLPATAVVTILIEGADIAITKTPSITADAEVGDIITYTYTLQNTGNVPLTNANVTDVHSGTGTLSAITPASVSLAVGASRDFTATYEVTQADIDSGANITNIATANASSTVGPVPQPTADASVSVTAPTPEALFSKLASPDAGLINGDSVTYSYTVENTGNITLTNLSISDAHEGLGTLSAITPANVATLAPGDTATFTSTYEITDGDFDAATPIDNIATLNATPERGTLPILTADETVEIDTPNPSVELDKTADITTGLEVGDIVTYTYDLGNTGNVVLNNVSISDAHEGTGTLSAFTPASVASLSPGERVSFTATYEITQADIDAGTPINNVASVNADPAFGSFTSPTADETVELIAAAPSSALTKTASQDTGLIAGDVVTYTYVVTNDGNVTLSDVSVSDVHGGSGTLTAITPASVASLAVGESANFTADYEITQADFEAGTAITNIATTAATPASGTLEASTAQESVSLADATPSAALNKDADVTSDVAVGDTVTYTYTVVNDGDVALNNVSISDIHSGSGTLSAIAPTSVATLAIGDEAVFTATYVVTQTDIDTTTSLTNVATLLATAERGNLPAITDDEEVILDAPERAMTLEKTASQTADAQVGDVITYTYEVVNTGNITMNDVTVTDAHSGSAALSAITPSSVSLAPLQSQTFTATYVVTQDDIDEGAPITNVATLTATPASGTFDPITDNAVVTIEAPTPAMDLEKTASQTVDARAGDIITYTYKTRNSGNVTMSNVSITDVHSGTASLSNITPASVTLAPGENQTFTATYTVTQDDVDANTPITNVATLNGSPASGIYEPVTDDASVDVIAEPSANFTKSADVTTDLKTGDIVTYSYEFENTGNVALENLSITDVHEGTGALSAITPASVASLAAGDTVVFTATYEVTLADFESGVDITNIATANFTPERGTLEPLESDASVSIAEAAPRAELTKTADVTTDVQVGDTVTYTYTVLNDGDVTLTDLSISDVHSGSAALSTITPANVATLAIGNSVDFTASYVVTQADIDAAADITNVATLAVTPARGTLPSLTDDAAITLDAPVPAMTLVKTANQTTNATVGDIIVYTYDVVNTGNVTMSAVSISDAHSGTGTLSAITPASVTLAPNQTQTFTASYTVTQADIDAGAPITNVATLNATPASGTYTPITDDALVTVETPVPTMTLEKTADRTIDLTVGETVTYTYNVVNTGNVTFDFVNISDVHNGAGTLSNIIPGSVNDFAPDDVASFTATYEITQADIDAGVPITNIATLNGTPRLGDYTPVTDNESVALVAPIAELDLVKTANLTTGAAVGDVISYTYDVINTGNVTMTNVSIGDVHSGTGALSAITPNNISALAPGATAQFTSSYVITQADIDAGTDITNVATANATPLAGTYTATTDDAVVELVPAAPAIDFEKTADVSTDLALGDIVTYTYTAKNTGNVTIENLSVSDVHSGQGALSAITPASVASLIVGQTISFTTSYQVTQADIDAGVPITNVATLAATPVLGSLPVISDDESVTLVNQTEGLSLDKRALNTDFAAVNDVLTYEYDLVNTGNVTLSNLSVADDRIATVICPVTTLAPNASTTCSANYTVTQADLDAGDVINIASATADTPNGTLSSPTDTASVEATQSPELTLVKAAIETGFAALNDQINYNYTVRNIGNVEITNLTVSDDRIASVVCPVTILAPTESTVCAGVYTITQADLDAGSVTNIAIADGTPAGGDLTAPDDSVTVNGTQNPALGLVKTALDSSFAAVGETLDYEYEVTNTGNVTIIDPITVRDDRISNVSCPALPTGGLQPTQSLTCTASYAVTQADLNAGDVTNIASATDGTTNSLTDDAIVEATQTPSLTLDKTANETTFAVVGDVLTYNYLVRNTGNVRIANINVSDDLISAVNCNVPVVGNNDIYLDPTEAVTCTASYNVTQNDLNTGLVTNNAVANGTPDGGTLEPATDDETVTADQLPILTLAKTAKEPSFAAVGDVLTYDYLVTNTGNVQITNISVSDDRISNINCPVTSLMPSESVTCTATDTVTQADIDAGSVVNNALATGDPVGGTLTDPTDQESVSAVQSPALDIVKNVTDENFVSPGDITSYEYIVTNTGNVTITAPITVTDNLIANVTCPALPTGGLAPTASLTCTGDYVVTQADLDAGSVTNLASASDGTISSPQTSETIPADQDPALSIVKSSTTSEITLAGQIVTYSFEIRNDGNLTLTGGVDVIDDKIGTINCVAGNFIPGATATCTADYIVTQADIDAGFVTNQAFAQNGTTVSVPDDLTIDGDQSPSLAFAKTALTADFINAGDVLDYEFRLENTGNVTLTNVSVSDPLIAPVSCPANTLAPNDVIVCTGSYSATQADVDAGEVINTASGFGTPPNGAAPLTQADNALVQSNANPSFAFEKRATNAEFTAVGDILSYEFDVVNTGSVTLNNISIADDLVASVTCPTATLAPTASMVCSANYSVTQADIDTGEVVNNAVASAVPADGSPLANLPSEAIVEANQIPAFTFDKRAVTADFAAVGDVLSYEYEVVNTGNVMISNLSVTDNLIANVSCPVTTLAPSQSIICLADYTVTQADIDAGFVTNIANASGTPAGGTLAPQTDDETIDAVQSPSLELVKTALDTSFSSVGTALDYEYLVTNTGNVTITDPISVTDDRIASVTCPLLPLGGLPPNASLTCTATYLVTQADIDAGEVTNIAAASAGGLTSASDEATVEATQTPAIVMTKTATPQVFASVGETINYSYVITNTGNVTITQPLTVSDNRIASVICPSLPIGGLIPGESLTCSGTDVVMQVDIDAGTIENIASATDGNLTTPDVTETVNAVQTPALSLVKTALDTSFASVGDLIDYTYLVTNSGNITLTDPVTISDDKIANVSCPALPGGTLIPGASITCSATYAVTQDDLDVGFVTNVASASIPDATSPTDTATVNADQQPELSLVKTALQNSFDTVGDVLDYQYTVRNTGNVTLMGNVTITDDRIASVACPAIAASGFPPNATHICTASYIVTQADIDAGEVINIATAANGNLVSESDSATVNADQNPALDLVKSSQESTYSTPGDVINYEYTVINSGNTTIIDPITISDNRIASVSCPALPAGGLVPGGQIICSASDVATQADIDAGVIENTANASDGTTGSPIATRRVFATRNSTIDIEKNAVDINFTLPGDIVSYEYIVTNTGNVTVTDPITVNDNLISTVTCPALPAGGLAPNASLTCTADYAITLDNLEIGVVINLATASAGDVTSAPTSETIPEGANPAIEVRKSSPVESFNAVGDILTYEFEIENTGNVTLVGNVEVDDNRIGTIVCHDGPTFIPGQVETCTATDTVTQADLDAGFVTNDAFAMHPRTSSPPVFVTIPAEQNPDLSLSKSALSSSFAAVGQTINYEYDVTNTGNVTLLQDISVSDNRIANVSCPSLPAGGFAPGETITCTGSDTVTQADIDAGNVLNTATASDGTITSALANETVPAEQTAQLSLDKIAQNSNFDTFGESLSYSYIVTNSGNVTITEAIEVSDDRIDTVSCPDLPIGGLLPGASISCTATDVVTQADLDAGLVTNTATASAGTLISNPSSQSVSGTQTPALEIVKSSPQTSFAAVDDVLTYSYDVTNTGNVTITNAITVRDDRIANVSCPALPTDGLAPTESITCSASYVVTQTDIDEGFVTNIASASDGTTTSNEASLNITAEQTPALRLEKNALSTIFTAVGDILSYEYIVTNSGNVTIVNPITVSDNRIAVVNCPALPADGLIPTAFITCTASDTVTQADLDAGSVTNIASASDGITTSETDNAIVNGNQTAALGIDKQALDNNFAAVNDQLRYNYIVRNTGNVTIIDPITVSDDRISNVICPALPTGGLVPGAIISCDAVYSVTQADLDAGEVTNIASATDGTVISPTDQVRIDAVQTPSLALDKTSPDTAYNVLGQTLTYNYEVTNTGNVTVIDPIRINDDRIADVTCPDLPDTGLAPTASITCTATDIVTQADIDAGEVINIATATDGTTTSESDEVTIEATQTPSLGLAKIALTAGFAAVDDVLSYEYIVTNTGNVTLLDPITVSDDRIATVTCPALPTDGLAPTETIICTASDIVTQADIDAGKVINIASATDGTNTSNEADAEVTANQAAALEIVKAALSEDYSAVGDILSYTYTVTNIGNVTLTDAITVSDDRIASVTCPALPADGLAPTENIVCTADYEVTQADLDVGLVKNIASATDGTVTSPEDDVTVTADQAPALELVKAALNEDFAAVGDILSYTYTVTNMGNVTLLEPITVSDDRIANVSCPALPADGLAPTENIVCTADYEITQADLDAGSVTNIASATDGTLTSPEDDATVAANALPALTLVKTSPDTSFNVLGQTLTYSFEVTNTGNVTIIDPITVSDDRIANVVCPALPATGLAPTESITCTGTDIVTQADLDAGLVTNIASATDGSTISDPDDVTIEAAQAPALSLAKTALTDSFAAVGDTLSYEYIVTNSGNLTIIDPIIISDDRIETVTCPALPTDGLIPGAAITCTGTDIVTQVDLDAGLVTNIASATDGTITSDPAEATISADQAPALELVKAALSEAYAAVGDILSYTYTVTNAGNVTLLEPITVSDDRIETVNCPALPADGLVPAANIVCTADYEVTQADLDSGSVTNIASATDGNVTSPEDDATVAANALPALALVKTSPDTAFNLLGQTLTYNYEVTNIGNVTLTNAITINDDRIADVVCPELAATGLTPTASITCTGTDVVTQADIDAGFVTNIASATDGTATSSSAELTIDAAQEPALALVKTALTDSFAAVGDSLSYEYIVTNTGNVTLFEPISISDDRIADVICPALPDTGLAPNAPITCTGTDVVTQADLDAGVVTNIASASDGTTTSEPVDATVNADQAPALELVKTALNEDYSAVGDILSYAYTVTNTGNVTLTNAISVSDDRIALVTCPALPADGLAPTANIVCTADYEVTQADLDDGFVTNIASATDGNVTSPEVDATVSANALPALAIVKTSPDASFTQLGQILSYNYEVTNTGNVTLTNAISVSDDRIDDVTCPALPETGLAPTASITCRADYAVTQADLDARGVTNIASASDGTTSSPDTSLTIEGLALPALDIVKAAITENFAMPGDIVSYEYTVTNTGNVTLVDAILVADDKIETVICPALTDEGLAPTENIVCTANYEATQSDLDAGFVTNIASASSGDTVSGEVSETVEAVRLPSLDVRKTVGVPQQVFGPIFDVSYQIEVENTGNVTLSNLSLEDNLLTALAPAELIGTPQITVADFTNGAANDNYDGVNNIELLESASLAVSETGVITILTRVDITNGGPAQGNTATGRSAELEAPVPSNDPSVTPDQSEDRNPTPLSIIDLDGDGAPDSFESNSVDRDGDGIPDNEDYDPTGYFFCEENGQILTGGGITVTGPLGSNSSIGTANNIVIVEDGSDGFYQFFVTAPGEYTLTPTYPTSGVPSEDSLPSTEVLDVTSLLPDNPALLGGTELGDSGQLSDFSQEGNSPFYTRFDFEAGDPTVFANNLPLQHCGVPSVSVDKVALAAVELSDDGRQQAAYGFTVTNTGETRLDNVQLTDDLGAVFGANNVEVVSLTLVDGPVLSAPANGLQSGTSFIPQTNTAFNGVTSIDMLSSATSLEPGESVTLNLETLITPVSDGEVTNIATVVAASPLNGDVLTDQGSAVIELQAISEPSFVRVAKQAQPRTVQIGDPVLYTIDVTNDSPSTMTDLRIVDQIPTGFAFVPGSALVSDASVSLPVEPIVTSRGVLNWDIQPTAEAPLNELASGETVTVSLRLVAGPNVEFGAHENQAFVDSLRTGERSETATAIVDYIPEPSFDCTPIIGRVYDDVNHNGYPDDGEPGLPAVRLATVNGDIITTDQYGRYHIPCAAIADRERGSNFLLKADIRTLPLGYHTTTENPRVVRATRGKFVKINFGAAHRPKLRIDLFAADFSDETGTLLTSASNRLAALLKEAPQTDRAVLIYHADDLEHVNHAQANLKTVLELVKSYAPKQFNDIAMEASWGDAAEYIPPSVDSFEDLSIGSLFDRPSVDTPRDRVAFTQGDNGQILRFDGSDEIRDQRGNEDNRGFANAGEGGLRNQRGSQALDSDDRIGRTAKFVGRRDQGIDESRRPGRLQRWIGWGNKTTSYAEGLEIETTVDALNPVKRLNAQANVVSDINGRTVRVEAYNNYQAFIDHAELRLFPISKSVRSEPAAIISLDGRYGNLPVTENMGGEYSYVLRVYGRDGGFDETAQKVLVIGDPEFDLSNEEWDIQSSSAFGQNTILKNNIRVRGGSVRVYGRNVPGESVTVLGQTIEVDAQGLFIAEQLLPAGEQSVDIRVAGLGGADSYIVRTVNVKSRDVFYAAQIEATIGEEASGAGESFEEGRVAFYLRSRLNDRWSVTATADTGEAELGNLFSGLDDKDFGELLRRLDPDRFYPTYGDDSVIEQDAPTSGRFYARVERDDDYVLWGNYQTNFNETEFGQIQRTLYGAKLHWDENGNTTSFGDDRTSLTAYVAEGGTRQGRDEFRGTGGSVYYLRQGDISIGSEILRLQTRDSVSGFVIENRRLTYGTDYDLDFIQGRIILNQPLASTADDGRLFRDGSQGGNEQILVVDYEFTPVLGSDGDAAIYGVRGQRWFGDHLRVGGTFNHDTDGGEESDFFGVDVILQHAAGTYIKGEFARTEGAGVETFASIDGGFTFNPQEQGGLIGNDNSDAFALEAAVDFSEVDGINLNGTSYAYWRYREGGFAGFTESTDSTVEQYGGGVDLRLTQALSFSGKADITDDNEVGTNSFAEASLKYALDDKLSASAGVSFTDDTSGNSGTSIGGRIDYKIDEDASVYAFGQVGVQGNNSRTTDRIGVGGEYRLSQKLFGGGEISTGEDGLGARASLRYQYEDGDEYYVAYDLPLRARPTSNLGTFNLGARRRYGDALSVFGEERLQFNDRGLNGLTHAYGINYNPGKWNLGLSGETGRVDELDRDAVSATLGFAGDRLKLGLTGEWRQDSNVETDDERTTWLIRSSTQFQASEELSLQGKLNIAVSDQSRLGDLGPESFNEAEFTEASVAAAYRPIWDDRFNLIGKLVWLEDLSPSTQVFNGETLDFRQKSSIASIDASYDLSKKWTLGGKYAFRAGSVTTDRESDDFADSEAELGVIRLDYHFTNRWDALIEGRYLDIGDGVTTRIGGQAAIFRHVNDNAKIGVGLTYGGIEEDYLALVGREDELGWYINLVGKF